MGKSAHDEMFNDLRAQARFYSNKQNQLAQQSQQAFKRGNKLEATKLSKEGKLFKNLANKENQIAAEKIFTQLNRDKSDNEIDLHGLYVAEAINYLTKRIEVDKKSHQRRLVVIVGRGIHSQGGPKIKPAVIKFATKHNIDFDENEPNAGCVTFNFNYSNDRPSTRNANRIRGNSKIILEVPHRPQPRQAFRDSSNDYWHAQSRVRTNSTRSHTIVTMPVHNVQENSEGSLCKKFSMAAAVIGVLVLAGKLLGLY